MKPQDCYTPNEKMLQFQKEKLNEVVEYYGLKHSISYVLSEEELKEYTTKVLLWYNKQLGYELDDVISQIDAERFIKSLNTKT